MSLGEEGSSLLVCSQSTTGGSGCFLLLLLTLKHFSGAKLQKENRTREHKRGNFTQQHPATNTWLILQAHIISKQAAFGKKRKPNKT